MRTIPEIGTKIWASVVRPGFIVRTDDGKEMPVQRSTEEYSTIVLDDGNCRAVRVDYAARVEVLGYFNPDPLESLPAREDWWLRAL